MAAPAQPTHTTPRPTPKARPDPGPMRLVLGLTGMVAATAIATAIVRPSVPTPAATAAPDPTAQPPAASPTPAPAAIVVRHVTQYVHLQPGETAPPGATVVQKPAASPRVIVVTITPPPAPPAAPAPVARRVAVATTRQSGSK